MLDGLVAAGLLCVAGGPGLFVIRYDRRDTGRSTHDEPGQPTYTLPDMVLDAVGVLDAYSVESAHWVGFSMGGWVAQLAALDHADRVTTLSLLSTRPTGHGPADPDLRDVTPRMMAAFETLAAEPDWSDRVATVEYLVEGERSVAAAPFDEEAARSVCQAAVARARDIRSALANHPIADQGPRWRERLGDVVAPTLVLHGATTRCSPWGTPTHSSGRSRTHASLCCRASDTSCRAASGAR